jgi:ACS family sodium-dependent inorganic phosphate cotransporter
MLFGFFFSWAGDTIKRRQFISVTLLRKLATIFSHLLPGVFLILVGYVGCDFMLANVFLFFALGFNGAALISNLSNNQDLAPNFAGFLYGIMNTIGSSSGMIIPPIVEEIAGKYGNPIDRWQILFWIGAAVCIGSMVVFLFGGSGNIQSWNELRPINRPKDDVEARQTNLEPSDNIAQT